MANGRLFISFHSSDHLSRAPVFFNKVHDLVILLLSNALITPRFTASCPSALVGFESAISAVISTAITSNFARNGTLMSTGEFGDMGIAETLLFIGSDCISLTFGELFISHSFSLLGGRKNRDYDGSPFYFLVLHLVYESKLLKRDNQMTDILKSLSSPRRAKTMFKNASVDQVNLIINTLQNLRNEKELEAKMAAEIEERERQELEALRAQILEKNIDFSKLSALMGENKKPRKNSSKRTSPKPSATYAYGDNEVWDGVGEVPAALQSLLDEGFELSDFVQPA
ncbi:hypothetical protein VCJ_001069 [Vibrio metoecus]|nr:hypothetical protein VCJ_001069 [Vibrio metoecus]